MGTKIKRRYTNPKTEEYKIYQDMFDRELLSSNVLNRESIPSMSTIFWDKNNLQTHIELFETEHIPARQANLILAHNAFASYQAGRKNEGYAVDDVWPPHLLRKRVEAEARLDVAKREKEFLEERLVKYYENPEAERQEKACLEYGPRGNGRLQNGVLVELDGQIIKPFVLPDKDEILVIASRNSPYFGIAVSDYRTHIIVPWTKERSMHMYNMEKQRQAEIAEKGFSKIIVRGGNRKVHPSSLPSLPVGLRNYYAIEEVVIEVDKGEIDTSI